MLRSLVVILCGYLVITMMMGYAEFVLTNEQGAWVLIALFAFPIGLSINAVSEAVFVALVPARFRARVGRTTFLILAVVIYASMFLTSFVTVEYLKP